MPLQRLSPPVDSETIPPNVQLFLQEATRRIELFQHERCIPGFVPSHFPTVYGVLKLLAGCSQLRGRRFCEWGSGFGVVASLAALLHFEAVGIEQEAELVEQARQLANDFAIPVSFVVGSYLPDETYPTSDGELSSYDELGWSPSDFDVIYCYPWPDERDAALELFEAVGGVGSIFLMFYGGHELAAWKKLKPKPGKRG